MPIDHGWIQRPSIISINYKGYVTAEDINNSSFSCLPLVEKRRLYVLIDMTEVLSMPRNLTNVSFRAESLIQFISHPNSRAFAFVGVSTLTKLAIEVVLRNQVVALAEDRAEAIAFLRDRLAADEQSDS
jgi:hypothetical protein